MDVLNSLGNVADNVLEGRNVGILPDEFAECWESDQGECYFLDCREAADAGQYVERLEKWHNIPQGKLAERIAELPRDKRIVLVCNTGARSYEAQITLMDQGFTDVLNLQGGMAGLKKWGLEL
jgi:rhodanese-related sulfurtransferase